MNMQWRGTKFIEFWFSSFALISTGESIGVNASPGYLFHGISTHNPRSIDRLLRLYEERRPHDLARQRRSHPSRTAERDRVGHAPILPRRDRLGAFQLELVQQLNGVLTLRAQRSRPCGRRQL